MKVQMAGEVQTISQLWIAKQDAIKVFGYENHRAVFQKLLAKFKNDPKFKDYYMCPTNGVPILKIIEFEEFLKEEEIRRLKK